MTSDASEMAYIMKMRQQYPGQLDGMVNDYGRVVTRTTTGMVTWAA